MLVQPALSEKLSAMADAADIQQDVKGARKSHPRKAIVDYAVESVNALLLDRRFFWQYTTLLLAGQLVLGALAIRYVKCECLLKAS